MTKIVYFFTIVLLFFQLISCNNSKDYVEMIPADADFVIQVNPKSLVEKGDLGVLNQFQFGKLALDEINSSDIKLKELMTEIIEKPTSFGLDVISPIYVFGKKENNKLISTLITNVRDKKDFEAQLKTIFQTVYKTDIEFEEKDGYTQIKNQQKPFIRWNKNQFYFIAGEYGLNTTELEAYFNQLIKNENSLKENNSFSDFLKKTQDVNIWYTAKFINYFTKNPENNMQDIDYSKCAWATYLSFNSDNISFTQKFHPDPETKVKLEKRPMWKSKINTDFYKYFPAESFFNFSFAIHPTNTRYILNNDNPITNFLANYEVNDSILVDSFEGELLFNVFDFKAAQNVDINDYFQKNENFTKKSVVPQFVLAGRMKNKNFYNHMIEKFGTSVKNEGQYYSLFLNAHNSLYFSYKYNILYITNNRKQLDLFTLNRVEKFNFIQSEFSNRAKNSMFGYVNLNLDDYSQETKDYVLSQLPFGNQTEVQTLLHQFSNIEYNVTDEYTKSGTLNFKKGDKNTLNRLLISLDQVYQLFLTPQNPQNGSN